MNILLLGTPRSKSSIFAEVLSRKYNAYVYSEPFLMVNNHYNTSSNISKKEYITNVIDIFNKQLQKENKNHVVKLHGGNLGGLIDYIEHLNLKIYDYIYLMERDDFFDQACSVLVAKKNHNWTNNPTTSIQQTTNQDIVIDKKTIEYLMFEIREYLRIKQYLIENQITFINEKYENLSSHIASGRTRPSNIQYSNIVKNYYLKDQINRYFSENFNYDSCYQNSSGFLKALDSIDFDKLL